MATATVAVRGRDVDQIGGVPAAPQRQENRRRQHRDQRRLKSQDGEELLREAEQAAIGERVVHDQAVGEVPGIVPLGRRVVHPQPQQRGAAEKDTAEHNWG